ncbi:MAG: SDR family oxidoreductase [Deltaproteobacteria bacterium]|nr:SDR family oxidoreductase [Deltaproteobacteria bacterium]
MTATVLLVGGTGRTGLRTLRQLLERGVEVRAIVRTVSKLPPELAASPRLTAIEASLLSLPDEELQRHLRGCDAVISCLGHVLSLRGIFGPPRDLVTRATVRLCRGIEALRPAAPVRLILMSSVSVHRPGAADARRGALERALLGVLRALVPPARDNQRAADFLAEGIGSGNAFVEWAVVRPDTLLEGEVSSYALHQGLVNGIFSPGSTRMANVAHLLCELATDRAAWAAWKGKLPVITDQGDPAREAPSRSAA